MTDARPPWRLAFQTCVRVGVMHRPDTLSDRTTTSEDVELKVKTVIPKLCCCCLDSLRSCGRDIEATQSETVCTLLSATFLRACTPEYTRATLCGAQPK